MTSYDGWIVGGVTIPHVREVNINQKEKVITLSCSALKENILTGDDDPRDEIARLEALQSQFINNDPLLNNGTKLQIGPADHIITVTDDTNTWSRCALEEIEIREDNKSTKRIDYELVIHYQTEGTGGVDVYTPDFDEYDEIDYYLYSDQTNPGSPGENYGKELGYMVITSTSTIWKVEVLGTGDCATSSTDCWLEVNGQREYWHYTNSGDKMAFPTNTLPIGTETLEYILDTPSSTITLQTSSHIAPDNTCDNNKGCWPTRIRLYKE